MFENIIHVSHRKCGLWLTVCVCKRKGYNDKEFGVSLSIYNIKHVYMYIVMMTNMVI